MWSDHDGIPRSLRWLLCAWMQQSESVGVSALALTEDSDVRHRYRSDVQQLHHAVSAAVERQQAGHVGELVLGGARDEIVGEPCVGGEVVRLGHRMGLQRSSVVSRMLGR